MAVEKGMTQNVNNLLMNCDNIDDFKADILSKLTRQKSMWIDKINEILTDNNMSQSELAKRCGVSRSSVLYWTKGSIPQNRDMFIRIGFAAGYSLDEMNFFLKRYGRYPELYSKSLEDSIYMFVLNSKEIEHSYEACRQVFERVEKSLEKVDRTKTVERKVETVAFSGYIMNISAVGELKEFVHEYKDVYMEAYHNLYAYVKEYIRANNANYIDVIDEDSVNSLAETLGWSSSLRKTVYSIYQNNWVPRRNKVISLGIHLNMTVEEINKMLTLAKMEGLYVVNTIESIIMFAVYDAELNDQIYPGTNDLYDYVVDIFNQLDVLDDEKIEDYLD